MNKKNTPVDDENLIAELLVAKIDDKFHSLKEARESPDWPKWNTAIETELRTLWEKGTWELVENQKMPYH